MTGNDFWLRIGVACGLLVVLMLYFMWTDTRDLLEKVYLGLFDYSRTTAAAAVRSEMERPTDA